MAKSIAAQDFGRNTADSGESTISFRPSSPQGKLVELPAIHPALAALPFARTRNSFSGTANSAFPHFKQTNSSGKTKTVGSSRPLRPGKWMATSAMNLLCLSDPHVLHDTVRSLSEPIIARPVISPLQAGKVRHRHRGSRRLGNILKP